jgi:hypothetical protein
LSTIRELVGPVNTAAPIARNVIKSRRLGRHHRTHLRHFGSVGDVSRDGYPARYAYLAKVERPLREHRGHHEQHRDNEYATPVVTRKYFQLKTLRLRRQMASAHVTTDKDLSWSFGRLPSCHASTATKTRNTVVNKPKPV